VYARVYIYIYMCVCVCVCMCVYVCACVCVCVCVTAAGAAHTRTHQPLVRLCLQHGGIRYGRRNALHGVDIAECEVIGGCLEHEVRDDREAVVLNHQCLCGRWRWRRRRWNRWKNRDYKTRFL